MIGISNYYISIDGGGSKTEVCIYNRITEVLDIRLYDGININQIGEEYFKYMLEKIVSNFKYLKDSYICIGMPGYGESSDTDKVIDRILATLLVDSKYTVVNDVELAHYGSLQLEDGILILSGTGAMALSIINSEKRRVGGWGFLLEDEGSAFYIGVKALIHLAHVFDKQEEPTKLSQELANNNIDFSSKLVKFVYESKNYRKDVASLSKIVDSMANEGCECSLDILKDAAYKLADMVTTIGVHNSTQVSYAGSVFKSSIIINNIEDKLGVKLVEPTLPPVLGGILKVFDIEQENINKAEVSNFLKIKYNQVEERVLDEKNN